MTDSSNKNNEIENPGDIGLIRESLDHLGQGVSVFDAQLNLVSSNKQVSELLDFPPELFHVGANLSDMYRYNAERGEYGPGDPEKHVQDRMEQALKFEPHLIERVRPDGTVLEIRGAPLPQGGFVSTFTDITARKNAEKERIANEERIRAILEASPLSVSVTRYEDNVIVYANQALADLHSTTVEKLVGSDAAVRYVDQNARTHLVNQLKKGGLIKDFEVELLTDDGRSFWAQMTMSPTLLDHEPVILAWIDDITEKREARERLQHMALHDSLTGLANGRRFNPYMDEALARSRRHDLPGALLYFDLDGFKKVNDTLGHKFGDYLLQELAERLRNGLRETDLIARLGGDEFAIVLENLKISGSPYDVGNKILEIVSESFHDQGQEATVGASIGIAPFSPNSRNGDELVKQADTAMYRAKNTGKGRICVYDPTIDIIQ